MTPIEQVRPPMPGNWARRPEGRNKRGGQGSGRADGQDRNPGRSQPGTSPEQNRGGNAHGDHEHSVDELA